MLRAIAPGVLVHESEFLKSNTVVVAGPAGALLVDPGLRGDELGCLADDLRKLGQPVIAGFSTHPHWDHVLWDAGLGPAPRYATARCAGVMQAELADPEAKARVAEHLAETEVAGQVPLDEYGRIAGLAAGATRIPWDGPLVEIVEHQAHAPGHAALWIPDSGVLVAGDLLSDILIPMLDLEAADPIGDYVAALDVLDRLSGDVDAVVPGHGSVGDADDLRARIDRDRAYVEALRDGGETDDPRLKPEAPNGTWLPDVHAWQVEQLTGRGAPSTS